MAKTRKARRRALIRRNKPIPEQQAAGPPEPQRASVAHGGESPGRPRNNGKGVFARSVSRALIERVLLGPDGSGRRFTQDGPVLPEVWVSYASDLNHRVPLLVTPFNEVPAGQVARELLGGFSVSEPGGLEVDRSKARAPGVAPEARVAYVDQLVAANLTYEELLEVVMPLTDWWVGHSRAAARKKRRRTDFCVLLRAAIGEVVDDPQPEWPAIDIPDSVARFITLAGLIDMRTIFPDVEESLNHASGRRALIKSMVEALAQRRFLADILQGPQPSDEEDREEPEGGEVGLEGEEELKGVEHGSVYSVSLNRPAFPAIARSIRSIKADAAALLFKADCSRLTWAIIDSGIDARHPTFYEKDPNPAKPNEFPASRVRRIYDFTRVRDLLWFDRLTSDASRKELVDEMQGLSRLHRRDVERHVRQIASDVASSRKVNWQSVSELLARLPDTPPYTDHGTHVASILAGRGWRQRRDLVGVCPDLNLYDLRVLGRTPEETEFAVIAALQFIRQLNERGPKVIHGANLSLSIPHDVRNYACGRTPVCEEAERLTGSSVTVVAAAGNFGYHEYHTSKGIFPGYCAISITDPGNAEHVITVGATHRFRPHSYGVSFFSSRGPTGDGRIKPDLVAPGEKIEAAIPGEDYATKDGTSMAAPHVSGAAALLMARHAELTDDPERIKRLLTENATDLGREKYFQGRGMLDVLRAMQKP